MMSHESNLTIIGLDGCGTCAGLVRVRVAVVAAGQVGDL